MLKINVITQLLLFFLLAILINQTSLPILIYMAAMLGLALNSMKRNQFYRSIKRLKWFFLVMFIIFAFNTPGEHIATWPFKFSPTYEGVKAGLMQTLRISIMLATLALIMASNTKQQLISGFYFLFLPLRYLGLKVERFAARLWLTLHYVELQQDADTSQDFISRLKSMTTLKHKQEVEDITITFKVPQFQWADYVAIGLLLTISIWTLA